MKNNGLAIMPWYFKVPILIILWAAALLTIGTAMWWAIFFTVGVFTPAPNP